MDNELDLLLGSVIDSLAKLSLLLVLHDDPRATLPPPQLATAVQRPEPLVARSLAELADAKLITRFAVGTGRIVLYSASEDAHVRDLIDLLRTRLQEHRTEVVRKITLASDTEA